MSEPLAILPCFLSLVRILVCSEDVDGVTDTGLAERISIDVLGVTELQLADPRVDDLVTVASNLRSGHWGVDGASVLRRVCDILRSHVPLAEARSTIVLLELSRIVASGRITYGDAIRLHQLHPLSLIGVFDAATDTCVRDLLALLLIMRDELNDGIAAESESRPDLFGDLIRITGCIRRAYCQSA